MPVPLHTEDDLDELLTRPGPALVEFIRSVASPLVILGAGGKMGPTLAVLAVRAAKEASVPLDVVAVSRFTDDVARQWLERHGVRTLSVDLLDRTALSRLPETSNVISLVGLKFGTSQRPELTWAVNALTPAHIIDRYPRARIVALSTGNVYPLVPVSSNGSIETGPVGPTGEYAHAALARERIFTFCSGRHGTPVVLVRLNYAVELRYGVLVDIAAKVFRGEPVDVTMGYLNCIWQGDANDMILRSLPLASNPPAVLNLTGPAVLSVRELALRFGELLGRKVELTGKEADTALLSNPARACALLGTPPTPLETVMEWTARWIETGGRLLDRPTHFEVRDGQF